MTGATMIRRYFLTTVGLALALACSGDGPGGATAPRFDVETVREGAELAIELLADSALQATAVAADQWIGPFLEEQRRIAPEGPTPHGTLPRPILGTLYAVVPQGDGYSVTPNGPVAAGTVEFQLYAVDGATGSLALPLTPIGVYRLRDEHPLPFVVERGGVTIHQGTATFDQATQISGTIDLTAILGGGTPMPVTLTASAGSAGTSSWTSRAVEIPGPPQVRISHSTTTGVASDGYASIVEIGSDRFDISEHSSTKTRTVSINDLVVEPADLNEQEQATFTLVQRAIGAAIVTAGGLVEALLPLSY